MSSRFFCLTVTLAVIPTIALAGEPSKGTVITIASVGAWIIVSSLGIVLRSRRGESSKSSDDTNHDQKS